MEKTLHIKLLISILLFLSAVMFTSAQTFEPVYKNYTIDDGLPSNETYHSIVDDEGYLWIATDAGVARFNGYEFEVFDEDDGLEDVVVFKIYKDANGVLWFGTMSNRFFYFDKKTEKIKPFKHNNNLPKINEIGYILNFEIEHDSLLVASSTGVYFLNNGEYIRTEKTNEISCFQSKSTKRIYFTQRIYLDLKKLDFYIEDKLVSSIKIKEIKDIMRTPIRGLKIDSSTYIFCLGPHLYKYEKNELIEFDKFNSGITNIFQLSKNEIIINFIGRPSILYNVKKQSSTDIFIDASTCSFVTRLNHNTLIVNSLKKGFYIYTINELENTSQNELKYSISKIKKLNISDEIICTTKNGEIINFNLNPFSVKWKQKLPENYAPNIIDIINDSLLISQGYISIFSIANGTKYTTTNQVLSGVTKKDKNGNYWSANLYGITKNSMSLEFFKTNSLNGKFIRARSLDFTDPNEIYFCGPSGLYVLKNNKEIINLYDNIDCSTVKILSNDSLIIGTKSKGTFVYTNKKLIKIHEGYYNQYRVNDILIDDYIYICSDQGLYILNKKQNSEILHYNEDNGLPSNKVHTVEKIGNWLYIGTEQGISRLQLKTISQQKKLAKLQFINENSEIIDVNLPSNSPAKKIEFKTCNILSGRTKDLEFKLNNNNWKKSESYFFNTKNLKIGNHIVKFRIKNVYGNNSNILTARINIITPFYKSTWFLILCFISILLLIFVFARWRISKIQKYSDEKNLAEKQISELKDQALRARLNPHFVFNSLNSIQRLYVNGDEVKANDYLADFSNLFRKILDFSERKYITIEEELETLNLYLEIEQLRTNNAFKYNFILDSEIDPSDLKIPSLLLQPIVENAIWHGVLPEDKNQNQLKIDIHIEYIDDDTLKIQIVDNGVGYFKSLKNRKKLHEPKGVEMTTQRLKGIGVMNIFEPEKGGTIVEIKLKINAEDNLY